MPLSETICRVQFLGQARFWLEGIFFMGFGVVGLVGSLVTIAVLATKDLRDLPDGVAKRLVSGERVSAM